MISLDRARPYGHSDGFDVFPRGFSQGLVAILWRCIAENPAGNGRARGLGSGLGNLVCRLVKSPNTPEGALPQMIPDRRLDRHNIRLAAAIGVPLVLSFADRPMLL